MRYEATFTPEPDDVVVGYRMRNHLGDGWWKLGTVATIFILAMMGLMAWLMEFVRSASWWRCCCRSSSSPGSWR